VNRNVNESFDEMVIFGEQILPGDLQFLSSNEGFDEMAIFGEKILPGDLQFLSSNIKSHQKKCSFFNKSLTPSIFEIFTVVFINIRILFVTTPCKLVFTDDTKVYCIYLQGSRNPSIINL
jgi:hypothetical protein